MTQSEINIAIGAKDPDKYFAEIIKQIETGKLKYGGIKDAAELKRNFEENCIPLSMLESETMEYDDFLKERRVLMAKKMKKYFQSLGKIEIGTESVWFPNFFSDNQKESQYNYAWVTRRVEF